MRDQLGSVAPFGESLSKGLVQFSLEGKPNRSQILRLGTVHSLIHGHAISWSQVGDRSGGEGGWTVYLGGESAISRVG